MESSSRNTSSTSSNHYSALLGTVSELRNDLERAMNKISTLEVQNQQLQSNYHLIKEELIETRKKYNESQENYMSTVAAKFDAERQNEAFMEMLKVQLAEKTKEFEAVRDKFAPQDIDFIRIKLQEELEIPHRQKIQNITAELEQAMDNYNSSQRESERIKAEYEVFAENLNRELLQQKHEHETVVNSLRSHIALLEERQYNVDKDEQIRQYKYKTHEIENTLEGLRAEIKSMQMDKDDTLVSYEKEQVKQEQIIIALKAKIISLEGDQVSVQHKINNATVDIEQKELQIRSAKKTIDELTAKLDLVVSQYEDLQNKCLHIKEDQHSQIQIISNSHDIVLKEYVHNAEELNTKLYEREDMIRKLQRELSEVQLRNERKENELRKEFASQITDLKNQLHSMELENIDVKNQSRNAMDNYSHLNTQNELEMERLRNENARIIREKEMLLSKFRENELRFDNLNKKEDENKKSLTEKWNLAQQEVVKLQNAHKLQEENRFHLQKKLDEQVKYSHSLEDKAKAIQQEHSAEVEQLNKQANHRLESLTASYKAKLEHLQEKYKSNLDKIQKKANEYKDKAISAHNLNKLLSNNIETMQAMAEL